LDRVILVHPGTDDPASEPDSPTIPDFADLQRRYREKRRRWAWKIDRPYSGDTCDPDPGVIDAVDPYEG
jgi:hypothetical protein